MKKSRFIIAALLALVLCSCKDGNAVPSQTGGTDLIGESETVTITEVETDTDESRLFEKEVELKPDGSLHISISDEKSNIGQIFTEALERIRTIEKETDMFDGPIELFVEDAVVTVKHDEESFNPSAQDSKMDIYLVSVSSHSHTYSFDPPAIISPQAHFNFISSEEAFVFTSGEDFHLIFTRSGITDVKNENGVSDETAYNESVYTFRKNEEGEITYERRPRKYVGGQYVGWVLTGCVGRDEFALEEGYLSFEKGAVNFNTEKQFTADEIFDLEKEFKELQYSEYFDVSEYKTLDELLAHNSTIYERAK